MRKESVQKFDLEAAFKALNEVEIPIVKGIRPNREDLQEKFTRKLVTDILVEDYYDIGDTEELGQAQEEREAEIAKAKLARIEKIVDLEAESEDDLLPSYVGKFIMQCPQCMTLFYKNEEDIERSEETPDVVNLNEPCQHCGNNSGYTLIGKVDTVGEDEAAQYDIDDFEENELDLSFDEEETAEDESVEAEEEVATEEETSEDADLDLDLAPVEDEEEEVQESLNEGTISISKAEMAKLDKEVEEATKEIAKYNLPMRAQKNSAGQTENIPDFDAVPEAQRDAAKKAYDRYQKALAARPDRAKNVINYTDESLTEGIDKELDDKLKAHNDYIEYLKKMIEDEEATLAKATNEYVKKAIQRRLDAFKADLEEALPDALKDEAISADDLPTPEEADMKAAAENKAEPKEKKESLSEGLNLDPAIARRFTKPQLDSLTPEEIKILQNPRDRDAIQAVIDKYNPKEKEESLTEAPVEEVTETPVESVPTETELTEDALDTLLDSEEFQTPVSDAEIDKIKSTYEDLEENLTEGTDLLADDGTLAALIYSNSMSPEARKEKLLADPDFVKALEAFAQNYNMVAKPDELEDGVSAAEDMYSCAFEGIEGEEFENTLDELISYYLDIKAESELTEAAPQGEFVSKLQRNYSATEIMVKELKEIEPFNQLSTRTIQRILLPYYISVMGIKSVKDRAELLTTQAMIDFFAEEGFAPYALDHFQTMDPIVRKELLRADPKFMKIFDAWAKEFKAYPGNGENIKDEANSPFDYAFNIIFDCTGDDGVPRYTKGTRDAVKAFGVMYVNGEFDKDVVDKLIQPVEETGEPWEVVEDLEEEVAPGVASEIAIQNIVDTWEAIEDFDDESFNKLTENYLKEVYSNVKSFETISCDLKDNKLVIEGIIAFNSGKSKPTTFTYEAKREIDKTKTLILEGLNTDFTTEKAFVLNCKVDTENCLIVESLNYKYTINNTLVEGLLK